MDVGFLGLGAMGRPMARNLADAGHHVWAGAPRPSICQLEHILPGACDSGG